MGAGAGLLAAPGALDEAGAFRFSIGPSINWGIFNLGQVRARIRASDAASEADAAQWQGSLLAAAERATAAVRARARAGAASAFELAEADAKSVVPVWFLKRQLTPTAVIPRSLSPSAEVADIAVTQVAIRELRKLPAVQPKAQ